MIVNKKAKALFNKIFEWPEITAANAIDCLYERRQLKKYVRKMPKLTSEQKKAVKDFWKPYGGIDSDWIRYYSYTAGIFDPRYIPTDLEFTKIDQYYNKRKLGWGFNDKNYYSLLFPGIKQPKTVVRKIGGLFFDEDYHQIDWKQAESLLSMRTEVIVKPSQESGGGRDIKFFNTSTEADGLKNVLLDKKEKNLIVQDIVKQHPDLAKIHPQSLNTVRITTLMLEDGVHVFCPFLRMGANGNRVDNVTLASGIAAIIKDNGELVDKAFFDVYSGKSTDRHPNGMLLSEIKVPEFDKMIETVKRAAQYTGNFRLIGWDLGVDQDGDVVLIEANMRKSGSIPLGQHMIGPFFGDMTKKILDDVFGK